MTNTSEAKYESSRRHVDAVSENEHKRSLNLQIDQAENLVNTSGAKYESGRSRVNIINKYKRKPVLNLVVDLAEDKLFSAIVP